MKTPGSIAPHTRHEVQSWGKVILLGEHAVVYGHPAIASAIDRGVRATASLLPTSSLVSTLDIEPWNVHVATGPTGAGPDDVRAAFEALLATYETPRPNVAITMTVDLPGGAGLGCSAAMGVAATRAIDLCLGLTRTEVDVIEASLAWERVFHGNPSGIDSVMATTGGAGVYRRGQTLEPIRVREPVRFVVAHSGESSNTKAMVDSVARLWTNERARIDQIFDGIAALARNGRLALESSDLYGFGQLMNLNQALLNTLMLSTARLEELCAAARSAGALGAKLTGAGGGGCIIALVHDVDVEERVRAALEERRAAVFVADIAATSSKSQ